MEKEYNDKNQVLSLLDRSKLSVGLVENVESFSDSEIVLKTALGGLYVSGKGLKLEDLSIENGEIVLTGKIDKMDYMDIKEKRSFFRDLFR